MTAIEKAIAALEILFEYTNNESTEHPWWGITRQSKISVIGEVLLAGPFFSRESAENALEAQRYHFGKHARVYCFSASRGNDYPRLVNSAREALSELRAAQGDKVEGLEEAIEKHWMGAGDLGSKYFADRHNDRLPMDILLEAAKLQLERQRG